MHTVAESALSRHVVEIGSKHPALRITGTYSGSEHDKLFAADYDRPMGKVSYIEYDIGQLVKLQACGPLRFNRAGEPNREGWPDPGAAAAKNEHALLRDGGGSTNGRLSVPGGTRDL
jgi:hypothetical protein